MIRISLRMMAFEKWGWPVIQGLLVITLISLRWNSTGSVFPWYFWAFMAVAVCTWAAHIVMMWKVVDEVIDYGDHLRVRRGRVEEMVPIADIEKVTVSYAFRTVRIILLVRRPIPFGERIVFVPRSNSLFGTYGESRVAVNLKERVAMCEITGEPGQPYLVGN